MTSTLNTLALDFGAESGRAILGQFDGQRLALTDIHRFANGPVRLPDGLHWDVLRLWTEIKTGLSRAKLSHLMDAETWMNANKAVELGFADDLLFKADGESAAAEDSFVFSRRAVTNSLMSKVKSHHTPSELAKPAGTPISELEKRLALIKP